MMLVHEDFRTYRRSMSGPSTLIGREAEVARLSEWIDDLVAGRGRATLIEGEPGIGKSSLARAAAILAERRGCQVLWAAGDELGQALPLQPLVDALRPWEQRAEPRLGTIVRLLCGESNAADPATAASEQMLALLVELCSAGPTVLVVDDLQWADLATIGVWGWLARSLAHTPLLLIGTMRPVPQRDELLAIRRSVGGKGIIRLGGLPDPAVVELVEAIVDGKAGAELLRLADGAAGNPLYLTELVDALVRTERLTVDEAGVVEASGGPVPGSLAAAIAHRLDFLPRSVRLVLQAAALLGIQFRVSDLAIVLDRRITDLVPTLDEARAAGVLDDAGERLSFRHPLIRAALYDDIPPAVRAAWHRDAAKALADARAPIHRVARQLLRAVDVPDAAPLDEWLLTWLVDAAPVLIAQGPRAAIDLLRRACAVSPVTTARGAVLACRLADALFRTGDGAEAERVASRAMAAITDPDLLVDLHWTVAQCRAMAGRSAEALADLTRALALPGLAPRHRARLLVLTARAHRDLGEVAVAGRVAAEALATAEQAEDRWAIGWALHVLIIVSMMQGEIAAALPLFERALEVIDGHVGLTDLGLLLQINQAIALGNLDRSEEALAAANRVRQLADQAGSLVRLAQAQSALGQLLFQVGRWDDAHAEVEILPDELKDPGATCCDRGIAAVIAFHRGDAATARQHLRLVAPYAEKIGNRVVASLALARSLDLEFAGESEQALAVLTAGVASHAEELEEMEDLLPEAARLAVACGVSPADTVAQAEMLARRSAVPHRLAAAAYCRGLLDGDPARLLLAAERYAEAGRPLSRAKALEAAAIALADSGDRGSARAAFVRVDDLYDHLGAQWDLARLRALFRRYGIRRGPRAKHRQARFGWDSLTPAEARIAEMIAEGLSNGQIAERLVLSPRTISTHVSHIMAKLHARSRVDIARAVTGHYRASS
jgi:DNA-binding CsgD family transcriptional regulator